MTTDKNEEHILPSKKIYDEYSKRNVELDNKDECADLARNFSQIPKIDNLCHRLKMNLKNLNYEEKNDQFVKDTCGFLHYWLYDHVINELKVTEDNDYLRIISKLQVAWHDIIETLDKEKYICKPYSGPPFNLSVNDFKFRKEMYDYYYNYPKIENWELLNKNGCNETCKYLTSIKEKYENLKSDCSRSNNKCVSEFKDFDKYDPKNLIDKLGCKIQSNCNRKELLVPSANLEGTSVTQVETQDERVQNNNQGSTENGSSKTILNVALPASVFFVLFPMLYKMTPLGSRFGKANKIRNNIINDLKNEEGEYFLTQPFEQESMKDSDKTYNISYNNT
ncbi:PIR protein [Plasmodium vivax]|nr:PIR protein [Plasmodium vivax]